MQEDVMTDPSLCREALKGFGPPAEAARLKAGGRESLYHQLALHLESARVKEEAAAAMKKVQAAEERLAKQKADFESYKRTEQWAAAAGHQHVRSLTHLLAEERKLWKEDCARENENFYRLRQEINNLKAANAALAKEKAATEATMKEAEARREAVVKEVADANVGRSRMAKIIEDLKEESRKEVEARETILGDVNRRLEEAEARATKVEEERDDLATMNAQPVADRAWMRDFGVANVANTILDALENTDAVAKVLKCAREAGYKAGYTECLTHVNALSAKKFTDDPCALRGVDTEAALRAATEAYDGLIIPALAQIEECLDADNYVDRLRTLFEPKKD
ncbi:hypothetical protein HanXRQr2_Chr09g0388221 [Helianthus annuus]|uniref:Uncharacterized protein n=2 Tax=Helianthus annuus TaxID=4232 RepID=A0A9K3I6C7_HELAN|nr:hypothetical protein HanXRQr2_Chr09g0388221 [Helianthus annuus]KAJ0707472.1 hypothetical protein HanLR1_Chr09g0318791 [Helianthus annuus]KAJ0893137.1 hypothetical protein HanPSC8_Chr09g0374191 [Helianthus annuus]